MIINVGVCVRTPYYPEQVTRYKLSPAFVDCTAYAYARFHEDFAKDNDVKSVTVLRMEVPCCGGIERAATQALKESGKYLPSQVVTVSIEGKIM